jgi:hypothetical protein
MKANKTDYIGQFPQNEAVSISRIGSLVVINAVIFQEILANDDGRVQSSRSMLQREDIVGGLIDHWSYILDEIDYFPIFDTARAVLLSLSANEEVDRAIKAIIDIALKVVSQRTALRHDLMGRVYHMLLGDRETKSLATFYTSIPAATLLLKLALEPSHWDTDWHSKSQLENFKVGDLACGTGTLLMAAAEVITDNYVRFCSQESQPPDFGHLQKMLLQDIIFGYDVLPSARHLTASTLALRSPMVKFDLMNLWSLPYGEPGSRLGSIEFLLDRTIAKQDIKAEAGAIERTAAQKQASQESAYLPDLDLCVMNPPFTRSSHSNLLFGSLPKKERASLQKRLGKILREHHVDASGTAGLGAVFVAVGERALKEQGRLALVLPKALLSGGAWKQTRELIARKFTLENLVVSHEPSRWNFSENTNLSEVLVIARKNKTSLSQSGDNSKVHCLNLWKNPTNIFEALGIADFVTRNIPPNIETDFGTLEIKLGNQKFGEALAISWERLKSTLWMLPCAFAQTDLCKTALNLLNGDLLLPGHNIYTGAIPLTPLSNIGELGFDIRDIYDAFSDTESITNYPAMWGHEADKIRTLSQYPNRYLLPLSSAREGRNLRDVSNIWPKAAKVLIATRLRMNTQRLAAIRLECDVLSNVWWPFRLYKAEVDAEKALTLWLNSTLGLILLLAHRQEVEGSWLAFQKPVLNILPALDVQSLPKDELHILAESYDQLCSEEMRPFPDVSQDLIRQKIDDALTDALHLPNISVLTESLAREPIMSSASLV